MNKKSKKTAYIIDAIGTVVVTAIFASWLKSDDSVNTAGTVAAIVSILFFLIICYRFVWKWMNEWSTDEIAPSVKRKTIDESKTNVRIIFAFFLLDVLVLGLIHLIRVLVFRDTTGFIEGLNLFLHIDTGYYLKIAEQWYLNTPEYIYDLVFYPGFPIVIRLFNCMFRNYLISAVITSGVFYVLCSVILYNYLSIEYERRDALRGVKYLAILPASFFFAAPMSESLFLFLSISCLYLMKKEKWLCACIVGALCSFTRSLGVLIFVPLAFNAISGIKRDKSNTQKWIQRLLLTFIIPLGTIAYLIINYDVAGNPFAFSSLEYEKWGQSMGLFFDTIAFQIDNALADIQMPYYTNALGLWLPNVAYCFAALIVVLFASKEINAEYTLWFIFYFVIAIGATYLISAPRYLVACLPVYIAVVQITKNKKMDILLTTTSVVFGLYYLFAFAARWEVF